MKRNFLIVDENGDIQGTVSGDFHEGVELAENYFEVPDHPDKYEKVDLKKKKPVKIKIDRNPELIEAKIQAEIRTIAMERLRERGEI